MLEHEAPGESTADVRGRVEQARRAQHARGQRMPNARLGAAPAREAAALDQHARDLLGAAVDRLGLSARGCDRVIRVARTVADLAGAQRVGGDHLAEALRFRSAGALT